MLMVYLSSCTNLYLKIINPSYLGSYCSIINCSTIVTGFENTSCDMEHNWIGFITYYTIKKPLTILVHNGRFWKFYLTSHESVSITHGNGTTIYDTAIGTQTIMVYNF